MSTEIEKQPDETGLVPLSPEEQALAEATKADVDSSRMILPSVKLTQGLTKEVTEDLVKQGHWFNSLTGYDYGDSIELVVAALFKGYFHRNSDGESWAARGPKVPDHWPEQYAGKFFSELDDTEENFRALVNAGERQWESGPPISTTYNFVGLIVGDPNIPLPVRVSLMRGNSKTAQKIETLIKVARAPWDRTFVLTAKREVSKRNEPYFAAEVSHGGATPPEVRQQIVDVALGYRKAQEAGSIELAGDEDDGSASGKKARPKPKGKSAGLGMD